MQRGERRLRIGEAFLRSGDAILKRGRVGAEFAERFAVDGAHADRAGPITGNDAFASQRGPERDVGERLGLAEFLAGLVPHLRDFIPPARNDPAIRRKIDPRRAARMRRPTLDFLRLFHIPKRDFSILARRSEHAGHERQAGHADFVAGQRVVFLRGRAFPNLDAAIAIRRGEKTAIRRVGDGRHPIGVFFDRSDEAAVLRRVNFHQLIRPAERDVLLIRAEVRGEDLIHFIPDRADAFARLDVPKRDLARLPAEPAACEQELPVAAEFDDFREAFREGEHAQQFERLGVVKCDLFLPANGHERCPRTRGERGERIRDARADDGFEREFAGHRGRSIGPGERDDGGLHVVCGGGDGFPRRRFEELTRDPFLDHGQIWVGKFVAFRRHPRLFGLLHAFEKQTGARIPGLHNFAILTALNRRRVSREIEPGLFLVGVVTVQTRVFENRQDVIVIRDLLLRLSRGDGGDDGDAERI